MSTTKFSGNINDETIILTIKIKEENTKLEEKVKEVWRWCLVIFLFLCVHV